MEEYNVIKSANDKRSYKFLTLANELKVVLISSNVRLFNFFFLIHLDPEAETSAASLSVRAGFHLDSEDVQGLAHFCTFSI